MYEVADARVCRRLASLEGDAMTARHPKRIYRLRAVSAALVAFSAICAPAPVAAQTADPHALYETRCAGCHVPHARDLAQDSLELKDGNVVLKKSATPLADFLTHHPRKPLTGEEADVLVKNLAAMLQTGFLFQEKCIVCHERASVMARLRLIEKDGVLKGRYTGQDIAQFLNSHGRLTDAEAAIIVSMLRRQLETR